MKRIITVIVVAFAISAAAFSQTPSFRGRGYKGNISYTNMIIVWNGLDTSHGFMFDEQHYLGVGAGFYLVPDGLDFPTIVHFYADYHAYCFEKASTLVAGIKIGYVDSVHPSTGNINALEMEPNIGWNWGLKSGQGITLSLGACIMTVPIRLTENSSLPFTALPRLSLAFEF